MAQGCVVVLRRSSLYFPFWSEPRLSHRIRKETVGGQPCLSLLPAFYTAEAMLMRPSGEF